MVSGLRLLAVATTFAAIVAADAMATGNGSTPSAPEVTIPARMVAFRPPSDPSYNLKFYTERWKAKRTDYCADPGDECKQVSVAPDHTLEQPSTGLVKRVLGGFLVTAPMPAFESSLYNGEQLGTIQPQAGMVVGRGQYSVRITGVNGHPEMENIVVDFSGCTVDHDLNVTKFVAVH